MRRSITRAAAPLAVAALAAGVLTACDSGDAAEFDGGATDQKAGERQDDEGDGGEAEGATAAGASAAGVADVDPAEALVEQEYTRPGTDDSATFGVHSLVVEGDIMTLRLVITPDFSSVSANDTVSVYDITSPRAFGPVLVDRENLKEYSLVQDGPTSWAANSVYLDAANGEPMVWWGVYAAPEDDIDAVDIRVLDGMPEFTDVPIER